MIDLIYNSSSFLLFLFLCLVCIAMSFLITKLVHYYIPFKLRCEENQSITCVSAVIGIIYAILVGFIVLYELNNFNKADEAENAEAKSMFAIFRMAKVLPEPQSTQMRKLAIDYADNTINNEWPTMALGKPVDKKGAEIIEDLSRILQSFTNLQATDPIVLRALNNIAINTNNLFDSRQERVVKIHTALSANIWFVLLLGTFLTIGINSILGMEARLHLVCNISISLMVAAVLYLIVTLDRPYRGDFAIQPSTFKATLEYLVTRVD